MKISLIVSVSALLSGVAAAQQLDQRERFEEPEEIVVTGDPSAFPLRLQIEAAEKFAYETFNKFNDERRFDISCSVVEPIGSRFKKQVCQPEFEIQALRGHAQDYLYSMPGRSNLPGGAVNQSFQPLELEISRQRPAFKQKMKEVAEKHPEFLDAIVSLTRLQEQYRKQSEILTNTEE
jgi:hypothetical protein